MVKLRSSMGKEKNRGGLIARLRFRELLSLSEMHNTSLYGKFVRQQCIVMPATFMT